MMRIDTRHTYIWGGWVVAALVGLLVGFGMARSQTDADVRKSIQIWSAAFEEVVNTYVDPVDAQDFMEVGLQAMLSELDPYTAYISEDERATVEALTQGRYIGVGAQVERRGRHVVVESVVQGSTAEQQGLSIGDVVTHIDGASVEDWSIHRVRGALRGESGSTVTLSILRMGETPDTVTLDRTPVELAAVPYSGFIGGVHEGMGYVRIERFTQQAAHEVEEAIADLEDSAPVKGLVLDVRDNPGGLLEAAVDVGALFLDRGRVVVSTRGRTERSARTYRNTTTPAHPDMPLVLLVNGRSASASEILAGALQDHDRGVVLGQTTFGKGLVQVIRSLPHGASLKMTTARYYTPSGRSIQAETTDVMQETMHTAAFRTDSGRLIRERHGIEPDVPIDDNYASPLEEALQREGAFFRFASRVARTHPHPPAGGWDSDELLNEFRAWVESESIPVQTEAQRALQPIDSLVVADHPEADAQLDRLREALDASVEGQFDAHADLIVAQLLSEIRSRYLTSRGYYAATLAEDEMVQEATRLLNDERRYVTVLNP
ncbi:carboxyl-terminal protease [Longimonas halophila]|uniref:Carboxyl-terminal protease n=1 Tax=Longimonas halophila TaxID=1469170 RepID=A0A2H3NR04_9BACT|nr:S41 family peptidase [Longimonas halophila]PEN08319.1 carboxyl-terminal protease [Longimonas halophila]